MKEKPLALILGNSGLPSSVGGRAGLSSIITSESSLLGGVASLAGVLGAPKVKGLLVSAAAVGVLNAAGAACVVGVPKVKGLFSFVGVAGAAPNAKGGLVGVEAAEFVDG